MEKKLCHLCTVILGKCKILVHESNERRWEKKTNTNVHKDMLGQTQLNIKKHNQTNENNTTNNKPNNYLCGENELKQTSHVSVTPIFIIPLVI